MISPDTLKEIEIIKNSERQKVILAESAEGKKYLKRTISGDRREVYKVLSKINHTNIPKIHYVGLDDETVVIEEYIDGISLCDFIEQEELNKKKIISISKQVLSAMDELHRFNIIHRDIKPENILIDKSNHIWLVDYDIARIYRQEVRKDTETMGTFGYAPIEQYGMLPTDFKTDIYAFGVTLKALLESSGIKGYLNRIAKKCTRLDPSQRYKSSKAVKDAINFRMIKVPLVFLVIILTVMVVLIADVKEDSQQHSEPQKSISAETTNSDQIELNEEPENAPIEENKEETKELDFEGTFYEFADGPDESKYRNYHTYSNVCIFTSNTPMEHLIFIDDVKKTGKLKLGKENTVIDADISLNNGILSVNLNDGKGQTFQKTFQYNSKYTYKESYTTNIRKNADIICYDLDNDGGTELLIGISDGAMGAVGQQFYNNFNYCMAWCIRYDQNGFTLCEGDAFSEGYSFWINVGKLNVSWDDIGDITGYMLEDNKIVPVH